jgi:hypothetical protein
MVRNTAHSRRFFAPFKLSRPFPAS